MPMRIFKLCQPQKHVYIMYIYLGFKRKYNPRRIYRVIDFTKSHVHHFYLYNHMLYFQNLFDNLHTEYTCIIYPSIKSVHNLLVEINRHVDLNLRFACHCHPIQTAGPRYSDCPTQNTLGAIETSIEIDNFVEAKKPKMKHKSSPDFDHFGRGAILWTVVVTVLAGHGRSWLLASVFQ